MYIFNAIWFKRDMVFNALSEQDNLLEASGVLTKLKAIQIQIHQRLTSQNVSKRLYFELFLIYDNLFIPKICLVLALFYIPLFLNDPEGKGVCQNDHI